MKVDSDAFHLIRCVMQKSVHLPLDSIGRNIMCTITYGKHVLGFVWEWIGIPFLKGLSGPGVALSNWEGTQTQVYQGARDIGPYNASHRVVRKLYVHWVHDPSSSGPVRLGYMVVDAHWCSC